MENNAGGTDVSTMQQTNLQNCMSVKDMTAVEAAIALKKLAEKIRGPVAVGIWEGSLNGKLSGQAHEGEHIAVFQDSALIAPFGPRGDEESEACAALFTIALQNADKLAAALAQQSGESNGPLHEKR